MRGGMCVLLDQLNDLLREIVRRDHFDELVAMEEKAFLGKNKFAALAAATPLPEEIDYGEAGKMRQLMQRMNHA